MWGGARTGCAPNLSDLGESCTSTQRSLVGSLRRLRSVRGDWDRGECSGTRSPEGVELRGEANDGGWGDESSDAAPRADMDSTPTPDRCPIIEFGRPRRSRVTEYVPLSGAGGSLAPMDALDTAAPCRASGLPHDTPRASL